MVVVGDTGVGKSTLLSKFVNGLFTTEYTMTIGTDFHVKTISINTKEGPVLVRIQIWDVGGQERFSSLRPMYYRNSEGGLILFDLTSYNSFKNVSRWIEEIRVNTEEEIPLFLVGNKRDLRDQRAISIEEIFDFTHRYNLYYMETSAITGENVDEIFERLTRLMLFKEKESL
ncbi:MAG: Rab family GTPase [Promethearchaeota archaeon]